MLAPDFQKLSRPGCLVDQCDFYLHLKLHLHGLEITALGIHYPWAWLEVFTS